MRYSGLAKDDMKDLHKAMLGLDLEHRIVSYIKASPNGRRSQVIVEHFASCHPFPDDKEVEAIIKRLIASGRLYHLGRGRVMLPFQVRASLARKGF